MTIGTVRRVVSGGQTGADRAALDWAIAVGLPHGGYCPRGRRAEDGTLADCYQLIETASEDYAERTERNVAESDGTLICCEEMPLAGGTLLTEYLARHHGKPCLVLARTGRGNDLARFNGWLDRNDIRVLNVAGPRSSEAPEIGAYVRGILDAWYGRESRWAALEQRPTASV